MLSEVEISGDFFGVLQLSRSVVFFGFFTYVQNDGFADLSL